MAISPPMTVLMVVAVPKRLQHGLRGIPETEKAG